MRGIFALIAVIAAYAAVSWAPAVVAHPERDTYYPNFDRDTREFGPAFGNTPTPRGIFNPKGGKRLVVCKPDSEQRIRQIRGGKRERRNRIRNLRLLPQCKFEHIQAAVNAAQSGNRIAILPGVYEEEPSEASPNPDPKCEGMYTNANRNTDQTLARGAPIPSESIEGSYEYHFKCPNSQNMIAIMGDSPEDEDLRCDQKCNLQIVGTGVRRDAVTIRGRRLKLNVIKADRADGVYLRNFLVEDSDFNNIYVLETNGFVVDKIITRYSREYGVLSFASDNGLYDRVEAYGAGDSGVYPGSGPEGNCQRYGIEMRRVDSHHNNIGFSGTAANGIWIHDSKFHHNSSGITFDSFAGGHPGMPQDCSKIEFNQIYSNNLDVWNDQRDDYCNINKRSIEQRDDRTIVCPTFQNPAGTGIFIAGGNGNIIRHNRVWDNWRDGMKQLWVPRELRGEDTTGQSKNTENQYDTSLNNKYTENVMGVAPDGSRDLNGNDFWWDNEGNGNCWERNSVHPSVSGGPSSNVVGGLPDCPGSPVLLPGNASEQSSQISCATWDPYDEQLQDPPGCDWFIVPPEPK